MRPFDPALLGVCECLFADAADAGRAQAERGCRCGSGVCLWPWSWPWESDVVEIGEECIGDVEPEGSGGVFCRSCGGEVCNWDIRGGEGAEEDRGMVVKK